MLGSFSKRVLRTCGVAGRVRGPRVCFFRKRWIFQPYFFAFLYQSPPTGGGDLWCSLRLGEVFRSVTPSFLRKEEAKNRQNSPDVPEPACLAWQEVQAMRVGFSQVGQAVWVRMRMSSWPHAAHKSRGAKESQAPFWKHKWVMSVEI